MKATCLPRGNRSSFWALFLETDLFLELGILDDLVQRRCNSRVQRLKIQEWVSPWIDRDVFNHPPNRPSPLPWSITLLPMENQNRQSLDFWIVFPHQEWLWSRVFVELWLRYLLSLRSNHAVLQKFHRYCRTHSRRPSCKCRHWNCVFTLFVISYERCLRPWSLLDWSSFPLWCARVNFFEEDLEVNQR